MNLFFDTEFTSLEEKDPELISIGIVDERDEHAFYAELEHDKSKSMSISAPQFPVFSIWK